MKKLIATGVLAAWVSVAASSQIRYSEFQTRTTSAAASSETTSVNSEPSCHVVRSDDTCTLNVARRSLRRGMVSCRNRWPPTVTISTGVAVGAPASKGGVPKIYSSKLEEAS